jgi:oxygen-independent coproporphyrinogen-3 oxidase
MLLYLHIPFCDSKCFYCSFNSYTNLHDRIKNYFYALNESLKWQLKHFNIPKSSLETLFIGGGTPSVPKAFYYEDIFETLEPFLQKDAEITCEANPNSATKEWLLAMKKLGVNRFSFGVQSFNEAKLKALNRAHSPKEAIDAIENAYSIGVENISLDIIYDFYLDSKELLQKDLEQAFALPINHISTYELIIEKATEFSKTPTVKQNKESFNFFMQEHISKKFPWYEVSNYGLYKSRHNLGYWKHKEYLGVGAGAVGFIDTIRYYPHSNIDKFIKEPYFYKKEILSTEDIKTEKIFLGLRSEVGVDSQILNKSEIKAADILIQEAKLKYKNGYYFNKDYFLADELALFIMQN